ncbi:glutamate decarboxylase [Dongshaea marina]|uniref:glutamate decarboxylase n=1 Tax=Dongshaea marina TaxID=2047966 RepID=UPI000D3E3DDF|nr:glutamate decarboxylase [Dongshaea marina]
MLSKSKHAKSLTHEERHLAPRGDWFLDFNCEVPRYEMPEDGMDSRAAYNIIKSEMFMDANPDLNLSSFVTTAMEPEAEKLIMENIHKNFIDHDMYPQSEEIHQRCVSILANLFHAPADCEPYGTATIGSSEAVMLAALAHKWNWRDRMKAQGKPTDKPNIVFGGDVQIVWKKFARYFDVEARIVPMEKDCYILTADKLDDYVDENTICVSAICGSTFTGEDDDIQGINDYLVRLEQEKGWNVPLHVDGASGGFIAPFVSPDYAWDFRLEKVQSINTSGHKYGMVYPGVGWVLFRDKSVFNEELIFYVNYLGGESPTATLNFSRGTSMILAQYYNFLRMGKAGYTCLMQTSMDNAQYLQQQLVESGLFKALNQGGVQKMPLVAIQLDEKVTRYNVFDVSNKLRERGWVVSAYTLPANAESIAMLRIVVRPHLNKDSCEILTRHILEACQYLEENGGSAKAPKLHDHHGAGHKC